MSVEATVTAVLPDRVGIRARDGREWDLDIRDIPPELAREGQPINLLHDDDGWVTEVVAREPDPLPDSIRERLAAMKLWIDDL